MGKIYDLGIDVGSTTVKTVILDEGEFIYNKYERHIFKGKGKRWLSSCVLSESFILRTSSG